MKKRGEFRRKRQKTVQAKPQTVQVKLQTVQGPPIIIIINLFIYIYIER